MSNLLFLRRRAIIGANTNTPEPILPYDAKIAYLESSGSQYIDLEITPTATDVWKLKFSNVSSNTLLNVFVGCCQSSGIKNAFFGSLSNYYRASLGSAASSQILSIDNNVTHTFVMDFLNSTVDIDNGTNIVSIGEYIDNDYNISLFALNTGGVIGYNSSIKLVEFEIVNRIKLIPVRVGQVGYMYDTISGQLYGNDGTGDFILGADI